MWSLRVGTGLVVADERVVWVGVNSHTWSRARLAATLNRLPSPLADQSPGVVGVGDQRERDDVPFVSVELFGRADAYVCRSWIVESIRVSMRFPNSLAWCPTAAVMAFWLPREGK